jgi:hypothetical protein
MIYHWRNATDRRIRACANWPDCVGYRAQKTRFCGRLPFRGGGVRAPAGPRAGQHAEFRALCWLPALDLESAAACRSFQPGESGNARPRRIAVTSEGHCPDGPPGLAEAKVRACLTVQARGAGRQAGVVCGCGHADQAVVAAAGQLAVHQHGRGGQGGPGRDQGDLPARYATGADHLDGWPGSAPPGWCRRPRPVRVSESGRGGGDRGSRPAMTAASRPERAPAFLVAIPGRSRW